MPIDYKNLLKKTGLTVTATSLSVGILSGCSLFGSENSKKTDKKASVSKKEDKKKQEERKEPNRLQEKDFDSLAENAVNSQESSQNVAFVLDHMEKSSSDKQIVSQMKSSSEATERVVVLFDQELSKSNNLNTKDVAVVASNSIPTETKDNQFVFGNQKDTAVVSIGDVIPKPPVDPPTDGGDKPKPPVDPPTDEGDKPKPPVDPPTDEGDKPKPPVDPPKDGGDKPKPPVDPPKDGGDKSKPPVDPPKDGGDKSKPPIIA